MKIIELSLATGTLSDYANAAQTEPLVITRGGKPVALLAAVTDNVDLESASLGTNPDFLALLERSRSSLREQGGITGAEMRQAVIAEMP